MNKILTTILLIALIIPNTYSNTAEEQIDFENQVLTFE
jgi:hypothetical protein